MSILIKTKKFCKNYSSNGFATNVIRGVPFEIKKRQKIAQVLFRKIEIPEIEEVAELLETNRGDGAFGGTGIF